MSAERVCALASGTASTGGAAMQLGVERWAEMGNVHVPTNTEKIRPRHVVIAKIATKYIGSGNILDLGCGMGQITRLVANFASSARISIADAYPACLAHTQTTVPNCVKQYLLSEDDFNVHNIIKDR